MPKYVLLLCIGVDFNMSYIFSVFLFLFIAFFILTMIYYLKKKNVVHALIREYEHNLHDPVLIEKIYSYCMSDWRLRSIMKKYQANPGDIKAIYEKLLIWGNFKKYSRFIPISSFFYTTSLKYLLKHKDGDAKKITMKMMNFFHI